MCLGRPHGPCSLARRPPLGDARGGRRARGFWTTGKLCQRGISTDPRCFRCSFPLVAGGGGGTGYNGAPGPGSAGAASPCGTGGAGTKANCGTGGSGTANRGGGGGGAGGSYNPSYSNIGGAGGSGVVVLRAPGPLGPTFTVAPGTNSKTSLPGPAGGCTVMTFTVSGTLTIS